MNKLIKVALIGGASLLLLAAVPPQQPTAWVAPKEADAVKNPLKSDPAALAEGKKLYTTLCVVCHGAKGKGDGPAGIALTPHPADHSSARVQAQTDGALFWKITNGRAPMAAYKGSLKEDQRWQLVDYIRELGKVPATKK